MREGSAAAPQRLPAALFTIRAVPAQAWMFTVAGDLLFLGAKRGNNRRNVVTHHSLISCRFAESDSVGN